MSRPQLQEKLLFVGHSVEELCDAHPVIADRFVSIDEPAIDIRDHGVVPVSGHENTPTSNERLVKAGEPSRETSQQLVRDTLLASCPLDERAEIVLEPYHGSIEKGRRPKARKKMLA